jgi:hypothetical protein
MPAILTSRVTLNFAARSLRPPSRVRPVIIPFIRESARGERFPVGRSELFPGHLWSDFVADCRPGPTHRAVGGHRSVMVLRRVGEVSQDQDRNASSSSNALLLSASPLAAL